MQTRNSLGPGLMIGIPTLGRPVALDWALAFKAMNPPINYNTIFSLVKNQQVADARNAIAQAAIDKGCKYLFFLGDDTEVPPHGLRQLIHRLENHPQINVVGGVYCSKTDPATPLVFKELGRGAYWDWKIGEFFEVFALGMDCTLIRVDLLRKMEKPWFKTIDEDDYLDGINNAEQWTEDLWFFNHLSGGVYCDASVICGHWDVYNNKRYTIPPGSLPMRQKVWKKGLPKLLMIGPPLEVNGDWDITLVPEDFRVTTYNLPFEKDQFDWVCVTESEDPLTPGDLLRVVKSGGKISINVHPKYDRNFVARIWGGTIDGSFIEVIKDAPKKPLYEVENGPGSNS